MINVHVEGGGDYIRLFEEEKGFTVDKTKPFQLVCFTGGVDINSSIYGSRSNPKTMRPSSSRDNHELGLIEYCKTRNIPMVGICRGAQLLCAVSGGKLFQHVDRHGYSHDIETTDEGPMVVTSSHHQMMDPREIKDALVLGHTENRSTGYEYDRGFTDPPPVDYEVVYFPSIRGLAHQPHPEWMDVSAPYRRYFFNTIKKYLFDQKSGV